MGEIQLDVSEGAFPLSLVIEQEGVGGVTGKSPTVAVRDGSTEDSYLDFDDGAFKSSGWGTKFADLEDLGTGIYEYVLDVTDTNIAVGMQLVAEYRVDDGGDVVGIDTDRITVVSHEADDPPTAAEIAGAVWDEPQAGHVAAGTMGLEQSRLDAAVTTRASAAQATSIQADTDDIQTRLPATLSGGRMRSQVEGLDTDTITATALAASATSEIDTVLTASHGAGSWAATGPTAAAIADAVWDEAATDHVAAGSMGAKMALVDAAISTRLATSGYTAPDNATITLIKKILKNRIEETSGNPGTLTIYDDDDTTPLLTAELRDETGAAVGPVTGSPARRTRLV